MTAPAPDNEEIVMPEVSVLVVDDDIAITRILLRAFERAGCRAQAVHDGHQAIAALAGGRFDAMVCDIQMPRMTGRELCRHLATHGPYFPRCVFIVTSRIEGEERDWTAEYPAIELIEKPVSPKQILRRMARALAEAGRDAGPERRAA